MYKGYGNYQMWFFRVMIEIRMVVNCWVEIRIIGKLEQILKKKVVYQWSCLIILFLFVVNYVYIFCRKFLMDVVG